MKKLILSVSVVLLLLPFAAHTSSVKAQTLIDSMVRDSANLRRRETVYKSRSHWHKKKAVRHKARKKVIRRKTR